MNYWMVKQEPDSYSWDDFVKDGKTDWTGVRNYQARNNLRDMKLGDKVLFYHSKRGRRYCQGDQSRIPGSDGR